MSQAQPHRWTFCSSPRPRGAIAVCWVDQIGPRQLAIAAALIGVIVALLLLYQVGRHRNSPDVFT